MNNFFYFYFYVIYFIDFIYKINLALSPALGMYSILKPYYTTICVTTRLFTHT